MDKTSTISFRSTATKEDANEIIRLLESKNIEAEIIKESFNPASTFGEGSLTSNFEIEIEAKDKENAEAIMMEVAEVTLQNIDPDYYLFSYADNELMDILGKKDEWSEIDVLLSNKILNDRGIEINYDALNQSQVIRDLELKKPEGRQTTWIVLGYILAFTGGFLGLLLGSFMWQGMKKLPDGTKVPAYNETTRKHALAIFIISCIVFPLTVFLRFVSETLKFQ